MFRVTQGLNDGHSTSCLSPAGPGSQGEGDWIDYATRLGSSARKKCPPQTPGLGSACWGPRLAQVVLVILTNWSMRLAHWVHFSPRSGVESWYLGDSWSPMEISVAGDRNEAGPRLPWAAGCLTSASLASEELPSVARKGHTLRSYLSQASLTERCPGALPVMGGRRPCWEPLLRAESATFPPALHRAGLASSPPLRAGGNQGTEKSS